jgi:hypothetical protein
MPFWLFYSRKCPDPEDRMKSLVPALISISILCLVVPGALRSQDFTEQMIDDNAHGSACLYAADIDRDGDNDVLGALIEENAIVMWRNDGGNPIAWTRQTISSNFYSAHSVYAADFDGDLDDDVVGASYGGEIAWWRNDGGEPIIWTKQTVRYGFTEAHEVFAEDVDSDGDIDILGAASSACLYAWWRNEGGDPINWTEQVIDDDSNYPKSICAADLDGDGNVDVAGASILDNRVAWWRNDGEDPINWTEFTISNSFFGAHRVQAIDIDGDKDNDILGAAYWGDEIAWWRNDGGDPISWLKQRIGVGMTQACIAYATDLDGDGDKDVLGTAQTRNQLAWWRNDGGDPITWTKSVIDSNFYRVWPLYACDLDGDLVPDVMAGSSYNGTNEVKWWENNLEPVGIEEVPLMRLPTAFSLSQNYPNPFNPSTTIRYTVPENKGPVNVELAIYDLRGRLVKLLVNKIQSPGRYAVHWNGTDRQGLPTCSGSYMVRIHAGDFTSTRKMVMVE